MKKRNKFALLTIGAMTSVVLLTGCSQDSDKPLVTMKGGNITQEQYYDRIKTNQSNEQVLQQMIIYKVAEERYGDKVSNKQVTNEYNKMKKQYGSQFESLLKTNGYTPKTYKEELRNALAVQAMLKANVKVSDKDMQKAFESYHPTVEAQVIEVSDENKAKELLDQVKQNPNDFGKVAKENSIADSASKDGKVSFDSTSTTIPTQVQEQAWKMKDGDVSDVLTVEQTDPSTYQTVKSYYIIKMDKQSDKGSDWKKYKSKLKAIVEQEKLNDATTVRKIMKKELKAADVKITDKELANVLASFTTNTNSSK